MDEISNTTEPQIAYSECCTLPFVSLYNENCIETMKRIPDGSIDLMLTDPPYNTTNCDWEYAINFEMLWVEWVRIVKPNGAFIFTSAQPFTSALIMSNTKMFKYEWIWEKSHPTGHLNAKIQPLRSHENILVFYKNQCCYNPQMIKKHYTDKRTKSGANVKADIYNEFVKVDRHIATDIGYPQTIQYFATPFKGGEGGLHPTQKPLDLMRYLILTYSNKGETVFDGYSGSGTTAEACMIEQRNFIGAELNKEYFDKSVKRLKNVPQSLF